MGDFEQSRYLPSKAKSLPREPKRAIFCENGSCMSPVRTNRPQSSVPRLATCGASAVPLRLPPSTTLFGRYDNSSGKVVETRPTETTWIQVGPLAFNKPR